MTSPLAFFPRGRSATGDERIRKKHPERGKEKLGSFEGTLPRFFYFYWLVMSEQYPLCESEN